MHRTKIPNCSKVKLKFMQWFFTTTFVAEKLRGSLLGALITVTIAEVCAYKLLKQNVKTGDLPHYTTDVLILVLALLETSVSPIIGWFGRKWRRMMLVIACLVAGLSSLLWFALPNVDIPDSVGYCRGKNLARDFRDSLGTSLRLSIILFTFAAFGITRMMIWCHGIAYIEEHAPARLSMHYGVLSTMRLLGIAMSYNILTDILETNFTLQVLSITIGLMLNALQMFMNIPRVTPETEDPVKHLPDDLSFSSSVYRVFCNTLATSQMVAMGLTAAALWGFAYHQADFIRAKYYLHLERNTLFNNAELLRNHAVILAVAYMGLKYTPPIMPTIVRASVLTHAAKMYVFTIILYVLMTVAISCERGSLAGLEDKTYMQPQCSQVCGCAPQWQEFSPVCVVDQMTTYVSPCHAGCTGVQEVGGLQVYANCTCATMNSRATRGPCSSSSCSGAFQLHQMLFALLLSCSALVFQDHGTLMLRAVDVRDKSVLLGMAGAFAAFFTFVFGHLIFMGISAANCIWAEGGRCNLHSSRHPYFLAVASGSMVVFSLIITVTNIVCIKLAERRAKKAENVTADEPQI